MSCSIAERSFSFRINLKDKSSIVFEEKLDRRSITIFDKFEECIGTLKIKRLFVDPKSSENIIFVNSINIEKSSPFN